MGVKASEFPLFYVEFVSPLLSKTEHDTYEVDLNTKNTQMENNSLINAGRQTHNENNYGLIENVDGKVDQVEKG